MYDRLIRDCVFAALDFESAGADRGETDQPVQIGIARSTVHGGRPDLWVSYILPGRPVLWSASQIHGITSAMLVDAPGMMTLWEPIRSRLGNAVVVGHNIGTEKRYLRCFPGHGFGPWIDTLILSKECLKGLPGYSLQSVASALGLVDEINMLVEGKSWHDALYDAVASWLILKTVIAELNLADSHLGCLGSALKS